MHLVEMFALRSELRRNLVGVHGAELAESMAPSYLHSNLAAAWVSFARLRRAARLHRGFAPPGPVLDFGAGTGVLRSFVKAPYSFVEQSESLSRRIEGQRLALDSLPAGYFAAVFALDSLEHNYDAGAVLDVLARSLRSDGVL